MATVKILKEAAHHGKVDVLEYLINTNPTVLADFKLKSSGESLLHEATKCHQVSFVRELIKIDPSFAEEMDKDGFRALDIAVILGNMAIVKEILSVNQDLCLLKGKDGTSALHHAAIRGRVDMIDVLLNSCPDSFEDVTVHAETAVHLAVKNHQFDAFSALLKWVERLNKEYMLNMADEDGNTILHLAVLTKHYACVNLVLSKNGGTADVNARNGNGWTVLDALDIQDSHDINMNQKLENAGAVRSPGSQYSNINAIKKTKQMMKPMQEDSETEDWIKYFKFQKERDSPSDTRSALLVVAALIATVCFQAGVNPPAAGDTSNPQPISPSPTAPPPPTYMGPGQASIVAALGSYAAAMAFLFTNTLGLAAATSIITFLTSGFPFQRELIVAIYSMNFTYGVAINQIFLDGDRTLGLILVLAASLIPYLLRWLPYWGTNAWIRATNNAPLTREIL